jgi:hypothetical protein
MTQGIASPGLLCGNHGVCACARPFWQGGARPSATWGADRINCRRARCSWGPAPSDSIKCGEQRGGTAYLCHSHPLHFVFLYAARLAAMDAPAHFRSRRCSRSPTSSAMPPVRVQDAFPWPWSTADRRSLEALVLGGQLTPAADSQNPAWMVPPSSDRGPNP